MTDGKRSLRGRLSFHLMWFSILTAMVVFEIATTKEPGVFGESEVSFESSFTVITLPPPATSPPLQGHKLASVQLMKPCWKNRAVPRRRKVFRQ